MQILKQSTVTTVYVGPVLDSAGAAVTTAVVGDFRLVKNGTAATLSGATVTHDANGYYTIALTTGNTDTIGRLTIAVGNTAMAMATHRYTVLLASVFDAIITNATNATGGLLTATAAVTTLSGAISTLTASGVRTELATELGRIDAAVSSRMATYTQPTGFLAATFPTTVASTTNITSASGITLAAVTHTGATIPTVTSVTNAVTAGTVSDKTGYSLSASGLASITAWTVAITGNITGNLSGSVGSVTGAVGSVTSGVTVTTNNDKTGYSLTQSFPANFASLGINASGHISRVTLVDTTTTNSDMRGTDGAALASIWTSTVAGRIDAAISTRSSHSAADVWSVATRTLTAFSFSVTVGTNNDKTGYSLATAPLDASGTAAAVWGALLSSYTTAGTFGGRVLRSDSSSVLVKVTGSAHVAADIHELQPAVIQATHFDLGAIDANALASDAASKIAASVWSAATRTLTAFSFAITVDAASIRSAIGMAAANLDTQLDAIPTAAEIDTQLTTSHGAGSWAVGGTGSGAFTLTITVNDGTNPLQNATVRVVEGVNAFVGQTNASGVVSFSLDAATYSVAITKDGYSFTPTTKVVSATGSQTYSMSQITPTIPAAAGLSTGTAVCYGTTGLPISGVVVTIQQVQGKGTDGSAYDGDTFTLTSNAQGVISHNGFVRGAVYSIRRGIRGEVKSFTVPDAASFDLSEIVGRD